MAPTRIGIDWTETPQRIGGLLLGRYICYEGSKGLKLNGADASTTEAEVVACLKDAVEVVQGLLGVEKFDAAVIVVSNNTSQPHQDEIILYGKGAGFNITQVISEHTAVSAAYIEKTQPGTTTNLAIISLTGGILEVSVVSIVPVDSPNVSYNLILEAHEAHNEMIDLEQSKEQGSGSGIIALVGGAVKGFAGDPFEKVLDIMNNIVGNPKIKQAEVHKVVLVGKVSRSQKVRNEVEEIFSKAEVWEGIDNPEEIVAYGAAYLSYEDKKFPMYHPDDPNVHLRPDFITPIG